MVVYLQPIRAKNLAPKRADDTLPSVSVVLCATNEYKELRRTLPILLQQEYPCYEVVVVNDRSLDNSEILLSVLQEQYPHLQVRTTSTDDRFGRSPSIALGMGIRAAKYDVILCIEADCHVKDTQWIRSMALFYNQEKEIVLGHTTYQKSPMWKRCDLFMHALHYMGRAANGRPYTGVGSNVLFKKSLFYDHNGFNVRLTRVHAPLRVFIAAVSNKRNCAICTLPSGVTHSRLKINCRLWKLHRRITKRSISMSPKGPKVPMLAETTVRLLFYLSIGLAFFLFFHSSPQLCIFFGSMLVIRQISVLTLYLRVKKKLNDRGMTLALLFWDFIFPVVNLRRIFR
jgi:glycosyltransferase involved in cell wall biosynthesis